MELAYKTGSYPAVNAVYVGFIPYSDRSILAESRDFFPLDRIRSQL